MANLRPSDENSPVKFVSPQGEELLVRSIHGKEEMGGLFVFQIELVSTSGELNFDDVVGQQVTAILELEGAERFFNGFVTEFRYLGSDGIYSRYHATVRPRLWMLTRTTDCRIFQNMKVPDIIKEIFRSNNLVDYKERLSGTYRDWEYCVQYNESDFNFISRLMEQEGIYYYFEHESDKHVMVLADDASSHDSYPGFAEVQFNSEFGKLSASFDYLDTWATVQSIMPNKYAIQDYDFKHPKADLLSRSITENEHTMPINDPEIFAYPGEYVVRGEGENYAEIRLQELQCQQERVHATGDCRWLSPGYIFRLFAYPRDDQNGEFLTISIDHQINNNAFIAGDGSETTLYRCKIEVMAKKKMPFRTPRKTPKPIVQGPQTAIVVGPSGDEIYTDEYGRVKVQFHWDRYGSKDENSSCWLRVSQLWAGTKWGGIHIPRIGQEVVVSFLEGDPDRPLVTGSVYNANCMPPYDLVANKTQSGIKSRSTTEAGADNFNEIRMEDKVGDEELYIQAEKDENILVKNNKGETVGSNETIKIGNNRHETVGNNETILVKNDRIEEVDNDEDLSVANNRTRSVGADETVSIGSSKSHSVGDSETVSIGSDQDVTVGANQSFSIGASRTLTVGKDHTISVGKNESRDVGDKLVVKAGTSILFECGSSSISMKKNGDILISGKNLVLKASSKATVKASSDLVLKGSKILEN